MKNGHSSKGRNRSGILSTLKKKKKKLRSQIYLPFRLSISTKLTDMCLRVLGNLQLLSERNCGGCPPGTLSARMWAWFYSVATDSFQGSVAFDHCTLGISRGFPCLFILFQCNKTFHLSGQRNMAQTG